MQAMFSDLTQLESQGDFRHTDPRHIRRAKITSTGLPCPDYTTLGSQQGSKGNRGGECYLLQGKWLVAYGSDIVILEQTNNVRKVDNGDGAGSDFNKLKTILSQAYICHDKDVRVFEQGDVSNRTRTYIVGIHKRHGDKARHWKWPEPRFNEARHPIAADIATPDAGLHERFKRHGTPRAMRPWKEPKFDWVHTIGDFGTPGVGDCDNPWPLQSWFALPNTQLTSNGGARRTMLNWQPGQPVSETRLSDIDEAARMASLSETYVPWANQFGDGSDRFMFKCINMGEPVQTCYAIHRQAAEFLEYLGVEKDILSSEARWDNAANHTTLKERQKTRTAHQIWKKMYSGLRSMLVDTGANGSMNKVHCEDYLKNKSVSKYTIGTAEVGRAMKGRYDGTLEAMVVNTEGKRQFKNYTQHSWETTTADNLKTELYSMDPQFKKHRWNLKIRQPDHETGVSEICRDSKNGLPDESIPIRYDHESGGGWWIDYILQPKGMSEGQKSKQAQYLRWQQNQLTENQSQARIAWLTKNIYDEDAAMDEVKRVCRVRQDDIRSIKWAKGCDCGCCDDDVVNKEWPTCEICANPARVSEEDDTEDDVQGGEEVLIARQEYEKECKGTKEQLKHGRDKWPWKKFHKHMSHCGYCDNCEICAMVKGVTKRYTRKVDPHKCTTP